MQKHSKQSNKFHIFKNLKELQWH